MSVGAVQLVISSIHFLTGGGLSERQVYLPTVKIPCFLTFTNTCSYWIYIIGCISLKSQNKAGKQTKHQRNNQKIKSQFSPTYPPSYIWLLIPLIPGQHRKYGYISLTLDNPREWYNWNNSNIYSHLILLFYPMIPVKKTIVKEKSQTVKLSKEFNYHEKVIGFIIAI